MSTTRQKQIEANQLRAGYSRFLLPEGTSDGTLVSVDMVTDPYVWESAMGAALQLCDQEMPDEMAAFRKVEAWRAHAKIATLFRFAGQNVAQWRATFHKALNDSGLQDEITSLQKEPPEEPTVQDRELARRAIRFQEMNAFRSVAGKIVRNVWIMTPQQKRELAAMMRPDYKPRGKIKPEAKIAQLLRKLDAWDRTEFLDDAQGDDTMAAEIGSALTNARPLDVDVELLAMKAAAHKDARGKGRGAPGSSQRSGRA